MYKILFNALFVVLGITLLTSCGTVPMVTKSVNYQSLRQRYGQPQDVPDDAKIVAFYVIDQYGQIDVVIQNLTDKVMIIDQTKSFFVNTDNISISYYDPTVRTTTNTVMASKSKGVGLNLGGIASLLGVGGAIGKLMGATNVGRSSTIGNSYTETTYFADLPQISLAPRSRGAMPKSFNVTNLGVRFLLDEAQHLSYSMGYDNSNCRFSICITYSLDNGQTWDSLVTDFYANSQIVSNVARNGEVYKVNEALTNIYKRKKDAVSELWYTLAFSNNIPDKEKNHIIRSHCGTFFNYQ